MCHQPPGTDVCITFKSSLMRGRFTSLLGQIDHRPAPALKTREFVIGDLWNAALMIGILL